MLSYGVTFRIMVTVMPLMGMDLLSFVSRRMHAVFLMHNVIRRHNNTVRCHCEYECQQKNVKDAA